jgi:hypothetical protein
VGDQTLVRAIIQHRLNRYPRQSSLSRSLNVSF